MQAFDTKVLVRLVLGDDPAQAVLSARYWSDALKTGGIFLLLVVLVFWVVLKFGSRRGSGDSGGGWSDSGSGIGDGFFDVGSDSSGSDGGDGGGGD